jgi:hypothetical protein
MQRNLWWHLCGFTGSQVIVPRMLFLVAIVAIVCSDLILLKATKVVILIEYSPDDLLYAFVRW